MQALAWSPDGMWLASAGAKWGAEVAQPHWLGHLASGSIFVGFKRFHGVSLFCLEGLDGSLRIWNVRVLSTELIHGGDT